jgi:hemolysin activation/secretion protein
VTLVVVLGAVPWRTAAADGAQSPAAGHGAPTSARPRPRILDINEYRVVGARHLSDAELEGALDPFLGPGRALEDVEKARAALEKAYSDKGYQSVAAAIPQQTVRDGVVTLSVTEGTVGRLRVKGARWFLPSDIKGQAPSVAEGTVPNFNDLVRDIVALNQLPDRRVTPALRTGVNPGTVDVDLVVQDSLPLHGSLEVNNRYSGDTTRTRLNGSLHYDNLWQEGHSLTFSFQLAPKRLNDGKVFSGAYLARLAKVPWLSFTLNGLFQDSDVSTLGSIAVRGRGRVFGGRATFTLPSTTGFFHTVSTGLDYKHFDEGISLGSDALATPITYWPMTAQYGATWSRESSQTQLGTSAVFNFRDLSSGADQFDAKRFKASGGFMYLRGELSRIEELRGTQLAARLSGQYSPDPLVGSEQFTIGGSESVRGYVESQGAGDYGGLFSVELRSPSLASWFGRPTLNEWRLHAFVEGGWVGTREPLPEQKSWSRLSSVGGGTRVKLLEHVSGSLDVGVPLRSEGGTRAHHPRVHFRLWSEF